MQIHTKRFIPLTPIMNTLVHLFLFALTVGLIFGALIKGATHLGYHWQWYRVPRHLIRFEDQRWICGDLLKGLLITGKIVGLSLVLALFLGFITAILRLSSSMVAKVLARLYIEGIRNTPLLIQIFMVYFVFAPVFNVGPFFSAVLALSLFEGAYIAEIVRSGIVSLPKHQWEAAYSLGMSLFQTYRYVILPQAVLRILPPLTGQMVSLIKDSALVSTIAIFDLTMQGQKIVSETFLAFEIWFTIAAIYLILTTCFSFLAGLLEKKMAKGTGVVRIHAIHS